MSNKRLPEHIAVILLTFQWTMKKIQDILGIKILHFRKLRVTNKLLDTLLEELIFAPNKGGAKGRGLTRIMQIC